MPPQLNKPSLDPEFMPPQLNKTSLDPENSKMMHRIKQYVDQYHDMLCIELDNESETHLFRHASEITKETKGGYLKGQIIIPNSSKPCYLRLSLVPSEPDLQNNPFHLHPNLLHLNLRQNKKNRNLKVSNFR